MCFCLFFYVFFNHLVDTSGFFYNNLSFWVLLGLFGPINKNIISDIPT